MPRNKKVSSAVRLALHQSRRASISNQSLRSRRRALRPDDRGGRSRNRSACVRAGSPRPAAARRGRRHRHAHPPTRRRVFESDLLRQRGGAAAAAGARGREDSAPLADHGAERQPEREQRHSRRQHDRSARSRLAAQSDTNERQTRGAVQRRRRGGYGDDSARPDRAHRHHHGRRLGRVRLRCDLGRTQFHSQGRFRRHRHPGEHLPNG